MHDDRIWHLWHGVKTMRDRHGLNATRIALELHISRGSALRTLSEIQIGEILGDDFLNPYLEGKLKKLDLKPLHKACLDGNLPEVWAAFKRQHYL